MAGTDDLAAVILGQGGRPAAATTAYTGTIVDARVSYDPPTGVWSAQQVTVNVLGENWSCYCSAAFNTELLAAAANGFQLTGAAVRVFVVANQPEVAYTLLGANASGFTTLGNYTAGVAPPPTTSFNPQLVGSVASTAARATLYAAAIAAGNTGMVCYVQDRDGLSVHRGTSGWQWMSYGTPLYDGYWAGPALQAGTTPQTLLTSGAITIPGTGQRRIGIVASVNLDSAAGGEVGARAQVVGASSGVAPPGMSSGQNFLQGHIDAAGGLYRHTADRAWNIVLNAGTQTFTLECLVEGSSATAQFTNMTLQVEDKGPYN